MAELWIKKFKKSHFRQMTFNSSSVRESAEFIKNHSHLLTLGDDETYEKAAKVVQPLLDNWKPESWSANGLHPATLDDHAMKAAWIFVIDTLNFAFWKPPGKPLFTVKYNGQNYTGYMSLCAAIRRALDEGVNILDPHFWLHATISDVENIFRSETETPISLLERRLEIMKEASTFLITHFEGSVYEMIKSVKNSAVSLTNLIADNLQSYADRSLFKGQKVSFLKRAQIFAADIHFGFIADNDDVCHFNDIDQITMFADYRVPQVLNYLGLLKYSDELFEMLKNHPHLEVGSEAECEIRGCSIAAVEKFKKFLSKDANAVLIDYCLWDYAKLNEDKMKDIPIHKTVGIFY
ncbi:hypothetical protein TRFO_27266 [Tritrichomonas foetus]|uniref:Queuosine 5'-phosphate N-glycosylase/hydrolase n=1 Tax=Tritrichomonas foetus TaxID=1144522 RepID=A0A1J4K619_9EUKA|nr:hypothetical protein TRFO_27266 [Tritrichomonas foetus]|eukprot:OHT05134.1 hypothetical protein TRFO_27266 [Tritrichomonas foetus]